MDSHFNHHIVCWRKITQTKLELNFFSFKKEQKDIPNVLPKLLHISARMDFSVSAIPITSTKFERGTGGEPFTIIWFSSVDFPVTTPPSDRKT